MAVQRSIAATAQGLSQRIIRYVETEYLGKTPGTAGRMQAGP